MEASIEIEAPPENIWEMLALDMLPKWAEGIQKNLKSIEYISEVNTPKDKYGIGAIGRQTYNSGKSYDYEITESLENEKIVYSTTFMGSTVTLFMEPVESRTRLTYRVDYEMPWGILGKIIEPLMGRMGRKEFERSLENLKSILEK